MDDLKLIKKLYGENMMHFCRKNFSSILEYPGLLVNILLKNFKPSRFLYEDIIIQKEINNFINYVYSKVNVVSDKVDVDKTPYELLKEVGYTLYECKTQEDILKFRKYYHENEKLCTFDEHRLYRNYVFFAVKYNADMLKREDFVNPERQDQYGTSVISIQFSKGVSNILSIKNRYNHLAKNSDATFSNNLDNIIPGLTTSFEKTYNFNIDRFEGVNFALHGYVFANDKKFYKYNQELNGIYYCPDNIIIDSNGVHKYDKERYIVMDYFILDRKDKNITLYDKTLNDGFVDSIKDIIKINVYNLPESDNKKIEIISQNNNVITIVIDKYNRMLSYVNNKIEKIENNFLYYNNCLERIELNNVEKIGDGFLYFNEKLENIVLPKIEKIGDNFLYINDSVAYLNMPLLKNVGDKFLHYNYQINKVILPNLESVGNDFLRYSMAIYNVCLPNLISVKNNFLGGAKFITNLSLPKLEIVGDYFVSENEEISNISLPNLKYVGNGFLLSNKLLEQINLPNLEKVGAHFIFTNDIIKNVSLPKLCSIGEAFLSNSIGTKFLRNKRIESFKKKFKAGFDKIFRVLIKKASKTETFLHIESQEKENKKSR